MISKKDLEKQRLMQMIIDLKELGEDLAFSIKKADFKNIKRFKMPTPHMDMAVENWEAFWNVKR